MFAKTSICDFARHVFGRGSLLKGSPAAASSAEGITLAQLEVLIADPEATTETWMVYAQRLSQQKRFSHAAMAYQWVLETDPYNCIANVGCASSLALTGDAARFYVFMNHLLLIEPRLILDISGRPEATPFLAAKNFQTLKAEAFAQSLD